MAKIKRQGRSAIAYYLTIFCYALLILQQLSDLLLQQLPWIAWPVKLLLLLFLPGIIRDKLRSYVWLCFVSLLYFIALVERLFAGQGTISAAVGMVAVTGLFVFAMLYVRWRAQELRAAQTLNEGVNE